MDELNFLYKSKNNDRTICLLDSLRVDNQVLVELSMSNRFVYSDLESCEICGLAHKSYTEKMKVPSLHFR